MGYALVIKGADFSAQSIGRVAYQDEPTPVKGGWMFGLATEVSLNSKIIRTNNAVSEGPFAFCDDYNQAVSFENKTISKIFIIPAKTGFTLKYGHCSKEVTTPSDFTSSKVEVGSILLDTSNINTQINITPFTVPSGKTIYFEGSGLESTDHEYFLSVMSNKMTDGVPRGIPGKLTNYYIPNEGEPYIRKLDPRSNCIDFYYE